MPVKYCTSVKTKLYLRQGGYVFTTVCLLACLLTGLLKMLQVNFREVFKMIGIETRKQETHQDSGDEISKRDFLHILASPGYAPGTIAVNVTCMERGFNAGQA